MKHQAACQCGGLSVVSDADPEFVVACNCKACQLRTGAAFGTGAYFPKTVVNVAGGSHTYERVAESGRKLTQHFCPTCGTNLYWSLEMRPDHLGIAYGCFSTQLPPPARAIWTSEKHDWFIFPKDLPQYEEATP